MRTLIVDDHELFSDGLRHVLMAASPAAEIVCCKDGSTALQLATEQPFELILLDWHLGAGCAGIDLLPSLQAALPQARIVMVSSECNRDMVRQAIEMGAVGFVPKEHSSRLLIDALAITAHGGIYLPASVLAGERWSAPAAPAHGVLRTVRESFPQLTERHIEVLQRVMRGMPNKGVARELGITDGTVKQHLNAIYRMLEVDNRTEAVYMLASRGVRLA